MGMDPLSVNVLKSYVICLWWSEILNFNVSQFITPFSYLVNTYCALRNLCLSQDHKDVLLSFNNLVVLIFTSRFINYLEMSGVN